MATPIRIKDFPNEELTPANSDFLALDNGVTSKISRENFLKGTPLPANTVDTQAIENDAVTTNKVADGAVTKEKMAEFGWVDYTPTFGASGSMSVAVTTLAVARYRQVGKRVDIEIRAVLTTSGTASNTITISVPAGLQIQGSNTMVLNGQTMVIAVGGTFNGGFSYITSSSPAQIDVRRYDAGNWDLGTGRQVYVSASYTTV
jgi:hypothetical protein